MVVAQAIESGDQMRALALFGVLILAKLSMLAGRPIELSIWTPIVYFWQDALVALAFWLVDGAIRQEWFGWILYTAAVSYVAINVPIARVLSSPLTWPMIGAARGALADSIKHYVTPGNLALILLIAAAAVALPQLLRRLRAPRRRALIIPALMVVILGPFATSQVETIGLHRNAIMALATTALPRLSPRNPQAEVKEDWRTSPFDSSSTRDDLSVWRGAAAGRNVVLILLESAGAKYLHPYGASRDPMPNLSELAQSALIFEDAYTVYPESIKALFSVLCSRYPAIDTETEDYARITTRSLAFVLKEAGYRAALFHSGRFMYLGMEAVVQNRGYEVLEDAGAIGGHYESSFGVDEPSTVRRALDWIDSLAPGERFFLTYLPIAGHHPYDTPEPGPFPGQADSDRYLNALHYSDDSVGILLKGLRERGLDQSTLFVIFGDHGEAFGQHEGNFGHSFFLYEENIRVPYLIAAPGLINQQVRIARTISLIDTAPTILDLLSLPSPADYEGRTALAGQPRMALFYTDYSLGLLGLRDNCWKYTYELDSGRSKLFDLCQDGAELNDLSRLQPERVTAYSRLLLRWSAAQKLLILNQTN
ncbi:MAG TPA: sulfatase [Blastocatellia bacterium]|nr:sulfatase [Blastocatellia bacterium]